MTSLYVYHALSFVLVEHSVCNEPIFVLIYLFTLVAFKVLKTIQAIMKILLHYIKNEIGSLESGIYFLRDQMKQKNVIIKNVLNMKQVQIENCSSVNAIK